MKCIRVVTTALVLSMAVCTQTTRAAILAGPISNPGNGNTYYLLDSIPASNVPNPFDASQTEAQSLGGNLATINDPAEDAWVFSTFDALAVAASPASIRKSLLIGLTDRITEGTFQWISGEPSPYTNWNPAQPQANTPGEDYVGIALSNNAFIADGKWHDIDFAAGDIVYGVVEVAVPEPVSGVILAGSFLAMLGVRRKLTAYSRKRSIR